MQLSNVSEVVQLHRLTFVGYMNTRLGTAYLHSFFRWFCEAEDAIALVAHSDSGPVGYVVGAPLGYTTRLNRAVLPAAMLGMALRPHLLFDPKIRFAIAERWRAFRGTATPDNAPDIPSTTYSLVGIAVHPEAQGQRIGLKLMDAFQQEAAAKGARSLRLSVYSDNLAARKLYKRAGWTCHPRGGPWADYYFKVLSPNTIAADQPEIAATSDVRSQPNP